MVLDLYSYHLSPFCRAVLATLKELNLEYNLKHIELKENGEQFSPEYLKMNPAHSLPTIVDDGFALWESRSIMRYLCNKYQPDGSLYPKDPKKRAVVDRLLDFDMTLTKAGKHAVLSKVFMGIEPTEGQTKSFHSHMKLLDQMIGDKKYLTGDQLTIADLSIFSNTLFLLFSGMDLSEYPNFVRWTTNLQKELPYFAEIYMSASEEDLAAFVARNKDYLTRKLNE